LGKLIEEQIERYQQGARWVAWILALYATFVIVMGGRLRDAAGLGSNRFALELLLASVALLLLAPTARGWRQYPGRVVALAVVGLALQPHALPGVWALGFVLVGAAMVVQPWLPAWSTAGAIAAGFFGILVALQRGFWLPAVGSARNLEFMAGVTLFALCAACMAAHPHRRPVAFFIERTTAGALLRRILPLTFLFPIALVVLSVLQLHLPRAYASVASWILLLGVVAFGVLLIWLVARSLDQLDRSRDVAGRELRESEERYRNLFENNPEPMWIYDAVSLRMLAVNESALQVHQLTRSEFLSLSLPQMFPPGELERADTMERPRRVIAGGALLDVEIFEQPTEWEGRPARMAFVHDITRRHKAESHLRASEARFRGLLESTLEGILSIDLEGCCQWCNRAFVELIGARSSDELIGRRVHDLVHHTRADGTPYPAEECETRLAAQAGRPFSQTEELFWRLDGTSFYADVRSSPLRDNGVLLGSVISVSDVSARRTLQAQFLQSQKMEAVGRLAAGIAHDFNNLLTVINGYAEMLLLHEDRPATIGKMKSIKNAGERAATLTQQLLAFSRQQVIQPRVLDVNQVLGEMESLVRRLVGEDLTLISSQAPGLHRVRADPGQIGQILMNLVVNARDAMPKGGRLTIETANVELDARYVRNHPYAVPGSYVMLAVTDTGTGMTQEVKARIFEPFFTTKPAGTGTGLGLATVFGIVKQNGGLVDCYSELGRGTSLKVYLPRCLESSSTSDVALPAAISHSGHENILVVEDEECVRDLVREVLEDQGYTVIEARDPIRALELFEIHRESLDAVVTDMVMPEMDGRQLVAELNRRRADLPSLFISGYPDRGAEHTLELEPGIEFLQKPFTPDALARKLRQVLDAHPPEARHAHV